MSNLQALCAGSGLPPIRPPGCFPPSGPPGQGTSGNDTVHIARAEGLLGDLGLYKVTTNGQSTYMTRQQLEATEFKLGKGDDVLLVDADVDANIKADGGAGNDLLIGGGGNDDLKGGKGNDVILGGAGNDRLDGGKGKDWIFGGCGNDRLYGGKGDDHLYGGPGHDSLHGGRGRDALDGGGGCDDLHGGRGRDCIKPDWKDLFGPPPHFALLASILGRD